MARFLRDRIPTFGVRVGDVCSVERGHDELVADPSSYQKSRQRLGEGSAGVSECSRW